MNRSWRRALAALALIVGGSAQAEDRSPSWVGSGSCAALACHGGRREPLDLKGSEYTFSEAYDPHARAYSVLYNDRSRLIDKNLRHFADIESARPYENDTCLRCHVHQGFDSKLPADRSTDFTLADGVSCEGCHGSAGKWLIPHSEYYWKDLSERQKWDVFGMRPTKDLLARGQTCTECHVGLGSTDVNHDLIAAGHPRLNFEYGSQLAKLPKHWRVLDDKARHPDYEAKVWALGQLLTAKASLDLLESRALRSLPDDSTTPWPEFAEYSCFSCHHELIPKGWTSASVSPGSKPGTLQWGTWNLPLTNILPSIVRLPDVDDPGSTLGMLRISMTRPVPDPALVARQARAASDEAARLALALNQGQIDPSQVRAMLASTLKIDDSSRPLDWDRAARQYLAIVALDKAAGDFDPRYTKTPVRIGLERLLEGLDLPQKVDRRGGIFDSPYHFDPDRVRGDLRSVQAALPNP